MSLLPWDTFSLNVADNGFNNMFTRGSNYENMRLQSVVDLSKHEMHIKL